MSTCVGCLLKSTQKCSNLVKELKRLSIYIKSYGQNRLQPIFLCIFKHFHCKRKSANWCTKMASNQKKAFSKMFLKFNCTAKYFWGKILWDKNYSHWALVGKYRRENIWFHNIVNWIFVQVIYYIMLMPNKDLQSQ